MAVLKPTTKTSMDERDPYWVTRHGRPEYWMPWDGNSIRIHPFLAGLTTTLGFLERPVDMEEGPDLEPDPRLPKDKQQFLPWAAAAYLKGMDGPGKDAEKAAALMAQFETFVGGTNG